MVRRRGRPNSAPVHYITFEDFEYDCNQELYIYFCPCGERHTIGEEDPLWDPLNSEIEAGFSCNPCGRATWISHRQSSPRKFRDAPFEIPWNDCEYDYDEEFYCCFCPCGVRFILDPVLPGTEEEICCLTCDRNILITNRLSSPRNFRDAPSMSRPSSPSFQSDRINAFTTRFGGKKEICRPHKFGFCKYLNTPQGCPKEHCDVVCSSHTSRGGCPKESICDRRHPRICFSFRDKGHCDRDRCAYLHGPPQGNFHDPSQDDLQIGPPQRISPEPSQDDLQTGPPQRNMYPNFVSKGFQHRKSTVGSPPSKLDYTPEEQVFPADFGRFDNEEKYFDPCPCGTLPLHPESDCILDSPILHKALVDPPMEVQKLKTEKPPENDPKEKSVQWMRVATGRLERKSNHLCKRCKKDAPNICTKCRDAWYCSRECQTLNWEEHKKYCKAHTDPKLGVSPVIIQCGSPPPVTTVEVHAPPSHPSSLYLSVPTLLPSPLPTG